MIRDWTQVSRAIGEHSTHQANDPVKISSIGRKIQDMQNSAVKEKKEKV